MISQETTLISVDFRIHIYPNKNIWNSKIILNMQTNLDQSSDSSKQKISKFYTKLLHNLNNDRTYIGYILLRQ